MRLKKSQRWVASASRSPIGRNWAEIIWVIGLHVQNPASMSLHASIKARYRDKGRTRRNTVRERKVPRCPRSLHNKRPALTPISAINSSFFMFCFSVTRMPFSSRIALQRGSTLSLISTDLMEVGAILGFFSVGLRMRGSRLGELVNWWWWWWWVLFRVPPPKPLVFWNGFLQAESMRGPASRTSPVQAWLEMNSKSHSLELCQQKTHWKKAPLFAKWRTKTAAMVIVLCRNSWTSAIVVTQVAFNLKKGQKNVGNTMDKGVKTVCTANCWRDSIM